MSPFFSINHYFEKIVPRGGTCQEGGCERKKITLLFTNELAHYYQVMENGPEEVALHVFFFSLLVILII